MKSVLRMERYDGSCFGVLDLSCLRPSFNLAPIPHNYTLIYRKKKGRQFPVMVTISAIDDKEVMISVAVVLRIKGEMTVKKFRHAGATAVSLGGRRVFPPISEKKKKRKKKK